MNEHTSRNKFLSTFFLFFYIYEFNFEVFGLSTFFTSRRISVLLFIVLLVCRSLRQSNGKFSLTLPRGSVAKCVKSHLFLQLAMLLYASLIILMVGTGQGELIAIDIVKYLLFSMFPILLFYSYYDDLGSFMQAILWVTIAQTIIIILCLCSSDFAHTLDHTFAAGETLEYITAHRSGYAGGLACITAPGAFKYSLGLVACVYFILNKPKMQYLILYFVFSVVITMVSRTGLFIAIVGLIVILWGIGRLSNGTSLLKATLTMILILLVAVGVFYLFDLRVFFDSRLQRLFALFENGFKKEFFDYYFSGENIGNVYVEINSNTFWGIGITSGTSGNGITVNVDGGFLRLIAALGVPMAVVFYLNFMVGLCRLQRNIGNKVHKSTMLFFIIVLLMAEFKEYTIYAQYMPCILFTSYALSEKQIKQIGVEEEIC